MKNIIYIGSFILVLFSGKLFGQVTNCIEEPTVIVCDGPVITEVDNDGPYGPHAPHNNPSSQGNYAPGEKVIFWMHGLGGNALSWSTAASWSDNHYQVVTPLLDYGATSETIESAATTMRTVMETTNSSQILQDPDYQRDQSIFIGHSLGGIVGRHMIYDVVDPSQNKQREFGAYATFGSPHHGSLASENDDNFALYLEETCENLSKPIVLEFIQTFEIELPIFQQAVNNAFHELLLDIEEPFIGFLCEDVTGIAFDFLKGSINPPIGKDVGPNSEEIALMNSFDIDIPTVACYGIEEHPISWRQIYSLNNGINQPHLDPNNPSPPDDQYFTANYDEGYVDVETELREDLFAKYEFYDNYPGYSTFTIYTFADWFSCWIQGYNIANNQCYFWTAPLTPEEYDELGYHFYNAHQWISDFNNNYGLLMGVGDYVIEDNSTFLCQCYSNHPAVDWPIVISPYECDPIPIDDPYVEGAYLNCIESVIEDYDQVIKLWPSDGVVPKTSANNIRVADGVMFITTEMPNSNHQQLRNDINTGIILNEMFDGTGIYPLEFQLTPN